MTEKEKIQTQIHELQQKLKELEEPKMTLKRTGDCDMVSYDHKYYYRLSFGVGYYWYKRYIGSSNLMNVEDPEEHRLVEELYNDMILDTGGVVEEQGTWNYEPDAKFRKQEPEENEWKNVALKFGKNLPVSLPHSYDELSPNSWYRWVVFTYDSYIEQRDKECGYTPKSKEVEKLED